MKFLPKYVITTHNVPFPSLILSASSKHKFIWVNLLRRQLRRDQIRCGEFLLWHLMKLRDDAFLLLVMKYDLTFLLSNFSEVMIHLEFILNKLFIANKSKTFLEPQIKGKRRLRNNP